MKPDHRHALQYALERGVAQPGSKDGWLFHNASPIPDLDEAWKQSVSCSQGFRPEYLRLQDQGYSVTPEFSSDEKRYSGALFLTGRNRRWNEHQIAQIWRQLGPSGRIIVAGSKTDGIGAIRKWFSRYANVNDSISKYHSVVFWADKVPETEIPAVEISRQSGGFEFADGMFSSDGPDAGSKLLTEHFDRRIGGKVADLGAGWGYLSAELLKKSDKVMEIDLFEADHASLEAARRNLTDLEQCGTFHWCDVTTEFPRKPYDWVIMNPPFHSGRAVDPELGKKFIEVAASTLPRGGRLLMVANRNLPYERTVSTKFRNFEKLTERDGFKVIEAVK
ncbi:MAG: class I SAM-dependent methyltransferase [Pseudomonadota bacterium]